MKNLAEYESKNSLRSKRKMLSAERWQTALSWLQSDHIKNPLQKFSMFSFRKMSDSISQWTPIMKNGKWIFKLNEDIMSPK